MSLEKAINDVELFHRTYNVNVADILGFPDDTVRVKRMALLFEEYQEYKQGETQRDIVGVADALGDIIYIAIGTALEYGIDLAAVWNEIQRANMSKLGADGKPIFREDGKVLKGPNYTPPDIRKVLGL